MGTLLLVRHAPTAASAAGRNLGQRDDPPLSAHGAAVADALGATLAAEIDAMAVTALRLVTSPALRCRQTLAAVRGGLGRGEVEVEVDPRLVEIDYGEWEGLTPDECRARDPELRAAWEADPAATRCPGGESGHDVSLRATPAFEALGAWVAADRGRAALSVTHNAVVRLEVCRLLGIPLADYRRRVVADAGSYTAITHTDHGPVLRRLNASVGDSPGGSGAVAVELPV